MFLSLCVFCLVLIRCVYYLQISLILQILYNMNEDVYLYDVSPPLECVATCKLVTLK